MPKILLVEDNEMNRDMLSRRLVRRGYEVAIAVDGREGVEQASTGAYDLVLLRWVLGFLPDPGDVVARLARTLRPGGTLAVIDYNFGCVGLAR